MKKILIKDDRVEGVGIVGATGIPDRRLDALQRHVLLRVAFSDQPLRDGEKKLKAGCCTLMLGVKQ